MHHYPTENENRRNVRNTILLLLIMPFALLTISLYISSFIYGIQIKNALNQYQPVIDYILDFKNNHGIYPDNVENIDIVSTKIPYFVYETYNNKQEFVFLVSTHEHDPSFPLSGVYRYCSSINLDNCNPAINDRFVEHYTVGEWVVTDYTD